VGLRGIPIDGSSLVGAYAIPSANAIRSRMPPSWRDVTREAVGRIRGRETLVT
jgi:hypothetical protein